MQPRSIVATMRQTNSSGSIMLRSHLPLSNLTKVLTKLHMKINKIIVAPDSFKGCLSASEVAECCAMAIGSVVPEAETIIIPLADGGEGTVATLEESFGGIRKECTVSDPLGREITTSYLISGDGKSALMEVAGASGLTLLSADERNPLKTSTRGLGMMIADALNQGCVNIMVGLGGSATNDGGMGMLSALGYRFLDKEGNRLYGCGEDLGKVAEIDSRHVNQLLRKARFTVACDVDNPLVGKLGATAVFGPQKGAYAHMLTTLESGMQNYAQIVEDFSGKGVAHLPGAGAAGGLGAAFHAFLDAKMVPGIDMVLDTLGFEERIKGADLIITGEGRIDYQSMMGKVVSGVLKRAAKERVPLIAIAGSVEDTSQLNDAGLAAVFPIQSGVSTLEEAMKPATAAENIRRTVSQIFRLIAI